MHHFLGQHLEAIAGKLGSGRGAVDQPLRRLNIARDSGVVIAMWAANCSHQQDTVFNAPAGSNRY